MKKKCLVIGIIILLFGMCVIPTNAKNIEKSQSILKGNWLYVGGDGPGNYSRIQDAIDNASDGDTVFVFDDSSPYYENIVVGKSITIQGENKNSTIIQGTNNTYGVNITVDTVSIMGFTIQNFSFGIYLTSNHNRISSNIFRENYCGIGTHYDNLSTSVPSYIGHNVITNNLIINNSNAIFGVSGWNNTIQENNISQNYMGITLGAAFNTVVLLNHISENFIGVTVLTSYNTTLYHNHFSDNELGVLTYVTSADNILQNNFMRNNWSAMSHQRFLPKIKLDLPLRRNIWDGNYWDEQRSSPYMIPGVLMIAIFKVHVGVQVDWHPAQEPYDIPGMT
jgi:parallel beta-helix repeat protein